MKTSITLLVLLIVLTFNSNAQSVGINATGAAPDNSALLDLNSTDKGFLITRADTANIPLPAFGLMTLAPIDSCLYLFNGSTWMGLGGGGTNCACNCSSPTTPPSSLSCVNTTTVVVDVLNPSTGKTWMDRNLGASQVATSSTDVLSYGDLYQWGRCTDGHEKYSSTVTATLSPTETPSHSQFITAAPLPNDWLSPQNGNLWQGVNGINNPCPAGYRLPTETELENERLSWSSNDLTGAFGSPLKLPAAGSRSWDVGALEAMGTYGYYWSSTINSIFSVNLMFRSNDSYMHDNARSYGKSVRCIKN